MQAYLDNAATTSMAPEVVAAMLPFLNDHFGNPSAQHAIGRTARAALEQARKDMATWLGARPGELIFTSGGTEANNLALWSAVRAGGVKRVITTAIEHPCVLRTVEWMQESGMAQAAFLPVDSKGFISLESLESLLADGVPSLVSVMHANNETGTLQDIGAIGRLCRGRGALFHSDTVQTVGVCALDAAAIPVDYLSGSAHKFHGPKGTGFLFARKGSPLLPMMRGGGQERGIRPGTENVAAIVGMARALELACTHREKHAQHLRTLRAGLWQKLQEAVTDVRLNGPEDPGRSLPKVLNVSFPALDLAPLLLFHLDMAGVYVSGGSACSSGALKGSHVLEALGADPDRPSVRFSFSRYTTPGEIDYAVQTIAGLFQADKSVFPPAE